MRGNKTKQQKEVKSKNKKELINKKLIFFALASSIILLSLSVSSLGLVLSDQASGVKYLGTLIQSGNLNVYIYDAPTGGNLVYNDTFAGAITGGAWNVMLGEKQSLSLEYGKAYYKDYDINGTDIDFTNTTGGITERKLFFSPVGEIGSEDLDLDGNVGIGTDNPDTLLHLNDSAGGPHAALLIEHSGDQTSRIRWKTAGVNRFDIVGDSTGFYIYNGTPSTIFHASQSGRFGMGTTSAGSFEAEARRLVAGDGAGNEGITVYAGTSSNSGLYFADGTSGASQTAAGGLNYNHATDKLALRAGGDVRATIDSSGNVGIGTTTPNKILHVREGDAGSVTSSSSAGVIIESDGSEGWLEFQTAGTTNNAGLVWSDSGGSEEAVVSYDHNTQRMTLASEDDIYLNPTGNVGIGTASPTQTLTVAGDINVTGSSYLGTIDLQGGNISAQNIASTDRLLVGGSSFGSWAVNVKGRDNAMVVHDASNNQILKADVGGVVINDDSQDKDFRVESDNNVNALFVQGSDGSVGIGTSSPATLLDVTDSTTKINTLEVSDGSTYTVSIGSNTADTGYIGVSGSAKMAIGTADTDRITIDTSGNVGIGTSSPDSVIGFTGPLVQIEGGEPAIIFNSTDSSANTWEIGVSGGGSGQDLRFVEDGVDRLFIDQDGKVGIGTNAPAQHLHIYEGNAGTDPSWLGSDDILLESDTTLYMQFFTPNNQAGGIEMSDPDGRAGGFVIYNHNGGTMSVGSENYIGFSTGGGTHSRIDPSGNWGIGTTSPNAKITVNGAKTVTGPNATNKGIALIAAGDNNVGLTIGNYANSPFAMWLQSMDNRDGFTTTYPLSLNPTGGKVGIGTSNPDATLHLRTSNGQLMVLERTSATHDKWGIYHADTGGFGHLQFKNEDTGNIITTLRSDGNVEIGRNNVQHGLFGLLHLKKPVASDMGPILMLQNEQYGSSSGAGSAIRFVGHYETTRYSEIEAIMRGTSLADRLNFNFIGASGQPNVTTMTLKWTGNVGIGTETPESNLEIFADSGSDSKLIISDGDVDHNITTEGPTDMYFRIKPYNSAEGGAMLRGFSDSDRTAISIAGLIGSNNPADDTPAVLISAAKKNGNADTVLGASETALAVDANSDGGRDFVILGDGKVGIGTTSPSRPLHIADTTAVLNLQDTNGAGGTEIAYLRFANSSDGEIGYVGFGSGGNANMYMNNYLAGGDILLLPGSGGNVGIGISAPDQELHVDGQIALHESGYSGRYIAFFYRSTESANTCNNECTAEPSGFDSDSGKCIQGWDASNGAPLDCGTTSSSSGCYCLCAGVDA